MSARKRAAEVLGSIPIDHADKVRKISDENPDWGYKRVGDRLGEDLGVQLESKHYQAVRKLLKAESADPAAPVVPAAAPVVPEVYEKDFEGNVRDHVDTIKTLKERFPEHGSRRISTEFAKLLRLNLSEAHIAAIRRIVEGICDDEGADVDANVREHVDSIKKLMAQYPDGKYAFIGSKLEEELQVTLSRAQRQTVRRVMEELSEGREAVGAPPRWNPERDTYEDFAGNLREQVDAIKELMGLHPPSKGRKFIAGELERKLKAKLSNAHVLAIQRIMIQHGNRLSYEFLSSADEVGVVQILFERHSGTAARRLALREHYDRDVVPSVVNRFASENYVHNRGDYVVRRFWKERFVIWGPTLCCARFMMSCYAMRGCTRRP